MPPTFVIIYSDVEKRGLKNEDSRNENRDSKDGTKT